MANLEDNKSLCHCIHNWRVKLQKLLWQNNNIIWEEGTKMTFLVKAEKKIIL